MIGAFGEMRMFFYVKWHNIQQLIVLTCGILQYHVGDAKSYGRRLNGGEITDAITVDLSAAYTQAYISASERHSGLPISSGERVPAFRSTRATGREATSPCSRTIN